ncbi:MAG: hypothetical protein ABR521_07565 [Gaiellaceae bacterium]
MQLKALGFVCGALVLLAGGASAAVPTAPLGLDVDGTHFALVSNHTWTVQGGADAREVQVLTKVRKGGTSARDRQNLSFIWASRCSPGRQTVIFKRALFMPGPPKNFTATFSDNTFVSAPADRAIGGVRLFINGRHAFSIRGASTTLARTERGYPGLFKHGVNTFEIRVIKRAEQKAKGIGMCRNGNPARRLGLLFALEGEFEADLWLSSDSGPTHEDYETGTPGATETVPIALEPRNLGPSGAYKGRLTLHISASTVQTLAIGAIRSASDDIENCKVSPGGTTPFQKRVDCDIDKLPPNRNRKIEFSVDARVTFHPHLPSAVAWVFVAAEIYSRTRDPNGRTNGWRAIRYICMPEATNPKCPK